MALNDEIITLSDVRDYRDVDASYSGDRFSAYLRQIQTRDLRLLLGDEFWYDFFINIDSAKYQTLIDGETYTMNGETVYYPGLKPYLCYLMLQKIIIEGDVYHTNRGNFNYNPETAQPAEKFQLQEAKNDYQISIKDCENQIKRYLNEKTSTYTLWDAKRETGETDFIINVV